MTTTQRLCDIKILLLDIETAPNLVHVWGLWQQNVSIKQIIDAGYVLCWAAKWLGKDEVFFSSIHEDSPKRMLLKIHKLLDEADAVVHYNGAHFDIPTLNKEFIQFKLPPPAPYKQIDLLRTARKQFRFPSNKLDYIAQKLGLGKKHVHQGHQLWIDCMAGKPKAWDTMKKYNIQDVILLERVYDRFRPWIKQHPNVTVYTGESLTCPHCGSGSFQARGYAYTQARRYKRFRCSTCHTWFRAALVSSDKRVTECA
jgi:uncharacterized protein YprB with RNaseH-like and TPR domain/ribosomal protein S27AE